MLYGNILDCTCLSENEGKYLKRSSILLLSHLFVSVGHFRTFFGLKTTSALDAQNTFVQRSVSRTSKVPTLGSGLKRRNRLGVLKRQT